MAKLWGFGDSFTAGAGIDNKNDKVLFPYGSTYQDTIYLTQLGKELNLKVINCALLGNSNGGILHNIVQNLKYIEKEDVVVIGTSIESRVPIPLPGHTEVNLQYGIANLINEYLKGAISKPKRGFFFDIFNKNELKTIHDYFYTIFPKLSTPYYDKYIGLFTDIQDLLTKNGNTCLIWDATCWDEFEDIENWTKNSEMGQVLDGHWSPNGNMLFKEILLQALNENTLFVNSELLSQTQWIEKAKEKHEYIPALRTFHNKKVATLI
jgi:hypothetical protein